MDLVVGATGILGAETCRLLRARGRQVKALVRESTDPAKLAQLSALGVQLVHGDLKHPQSLRDACRGIENVVTTASATLSRAAGDSIDTVDGRGTVDLIAAATGAGVRHFVLTSFAPIALEFPLQRVKREAERALSEGSMPWTVLQPSHFLEIWFSPALGFDAAHGKARVLGTGSRPMHWVSYTDVARVAVAVLEAGPQQRALTFGGPAALSQRDVIALCERAAGRPFELEEVPEAALRAQYASVDALEQSFAGLMLCCSTGEPQQLDNACLRAILTEPLTSAETFAKSVVR